MAGVDFAAILSNETEYPDTVTVTWNGQEVPLGELRKGHKERQGDLTRREQSLAQKARQVQDAESRLRSQAARAPEPSGQPQPWQRMGYRTADDFDAAAADPYVGPAVRTALNAMERADRAEQQLGTFTQGQWNWHFQNALKDIARDDQDYADPGKQQELVQYARDRFAAMDLRDAHKLATLSKRMEDAEKRGYEKGLTEGTTRAKSTPPVPYGLRSRPPLAGKDDVPADANTLREQASADPELFAAFDAGLAGEKT